VMTDPIHQGAAAGIVIPAPGFVHTGRRIRDPRSGAQPALPVESPGRRGRLDAIAQTVPIGQSRRQPDLDFRYPADPAITPELARNPEIRQRALPASGLPNAAIEPYGIADGLALGPIVRQRLLAVDVFPGARGCDRYDAVPVIGYRDIDGVDV